MSKQKKPSNKSSSPRKTNPVPIKTGTYYGDIPPRHRPKKNPD